MANGTLCMRNHVDIDQIAKVRLLDGIRAARDKFAGVIDVQFVAFPNWAWPETPKRWILCGRPWRAGRRWWAACRTVSGTWTMLRATSRSPSRSPAHDADIDMHVDETDDPYWHSLELLADKTIEMGYQGRVTAGHCCAMAAWDDALADRVIEKVRRAGVNVCTNAPVNLLLQGRGDRQPVRGVSPGCASCLTPASMLRAGKTT